MALLHRFDSPAFLPDFDGISGQREAWHSFISRCFIASIVSERAKVKRPDGSAGLVQFYNPAEFDPGGAFVEQAIVWNAFPKELLVRYGRQRALIEADKVWPLARYRNDPRPGSPGFQTAVYRPLNEYCEWHVERDRHTHQIVRVSFSSEPPEYWEALFGNSIDPGDGIPCLFPGDQLRVLSLYRDMISPQVQLQDLICHAEIRDPAGNVFARDGQYNPYNKWNTTHGIVHLCSPPNSITAEIQLGADATVLYRHAGDGSVAGPGALICCAAFGGPDRNSDPTIGATVNALAHAGAMITLPNPVGLYMDHVDLSGWEAPEGVEVEECVRIVRGAPGMIERLVVEVPSDSGFTVGDLTIGGEIIEYGGQIAECITVKLIGGAAKLGTIANAPTSCIARCCIDPANPRLLDRAIPISRPAPPGEQDAFIAEGAGAAAQRAMTAAYPPSFRRRAKE